LEGIDVGYEMGRAQALIDKSAPPPRDNTGRTQFEVFQTSAQIANRHCGNTRSEHRLVRAQSEWPRQRQSVVEGH